MEDGRVRTKIQKFINYPSFSTSPLHLNHFSCTSSNPVKKLSQALHHLLNNLYHRHRIYSEPDEEDCESRENSASRE